MADNEPSSRGREGQQNPTSSDTKLSRDGSPFGSAKPTNEESPLLSPTRAGQGENEGLINEPDDSESFAGDTFMETKTIWYMILLTISIGGLQLAWAVELSNGTPYLLSLGLSKSLMALVWIAGPLSGALVQPYVGILSDNCRSPWGKRTPFMIAGAAATIVSLLILAWVREIVGGFLGVFGANRESEGVKVTIIVVAVALIYILDFAINTVQAGIRAFILDCCPSHQQETANAMASRVVGVGNIIGYVAGYADLPKYLWIFGNTQFKVLCVIASIGLSSTLALSIGTVRERDASLEATPLESKGGVIAFFKQIFKSIRRLPPQTRKVCEVQFFAWIAFFPQLFYSSSYVGDIYVQPYLRENPNMTPAEIDILYEKATRIGTRALLVYAVTSLATNVLLPFVIAPSYDVQSTSSNNSQKGYTTAMSRFLDRLVIPGFTLRKAWLLSHLIFASCMFSTLLVRSVGGATAVIGIVGVSWAMTLWAPFAIISAEVSKRDALRRAQGIDAGDADDQAGVILGIHNMSIATPQILATVGSSIIFRFFQKPRGTPGDRSIAIVLATGGIFTLVAAFLTARIKDEVEISEDLVESGHGERGGILGRPTPRRASLSFTAQGGLEY